MKQFSLPVYLWKFFLYLIISLILHLVLIFVAGMVAGGYASFFVFFIGILAFPFGLWNFFFFWKVLPPDQSSKRLVGLASILFLPVLCLVIYGLFGGFQIIINSLPSSLFYIFGMLVSNTIVFSIAHSINLSNYKKRAMSQTENDQSEID